MTSGPQDDPGKSVNLGVAAHISAASPGGPRYDPDLPPEERSAPPNGIWLCQNCAKLIDNDTIRFSVEVLRKWKADAETDAKARVGKTAAVNDGRAIDLATYARVRIAPIVPREHEQADFMLVEDKGKLLVFQKIDSQRYVDIPKSFIEKIHKFGESRPALIQLSGRLQWVSMKRRFDLFPDKPPVGPEGAYGIGKDVDNGYPLRLGVHGGFGRKDRLPEILGRGWFIFYDSDGSYLRWGDQVFVVNWLV